LGLVGHGCRPEEAGQLAGDGDDGDVAGLAAPAEALVETVEAVLCAPGDLEDVVESGTSRRKRRYRFTRLV
jgi:hypothetical protein